MTSVAAAAVPVEMITPRMDTGTFLKRILPETGLYVLAHAKGKGFLHVVCDSLEELAQQIAQQNAAGETVYHACAAYHERSVDSTPNREGKTRKQIRVHRNVRALKCFFLDLDVKPGNEHAFESQSAALDGLVAFCEAAGLPIPMVVSSGNGIHIYWVLEQEILPEQWKQTAEALKMLAAKLDFKADPAVTADPARILRTIGTWNRKDPARWKPVELVADAPPIKFADFQAQVLAALKAQGIKPPVAKPQKAEGARLNEQFAIKKDFPPCSAEKVATRCAQVAKIKSTRGDVPEPFWYAGIQLLCNSVEGDPLIHEWSKGYAGYSAKETDQKISQIRGQQLGPTLCSTFESRNPGGCDNCPFKGKISSPAQLGKQAVDAAIAETNSSVVPALNTQASGFGGVLRPVAPEADQPLTDLGNARRFVRQHGECVRFVHEYKKWLLWNGQRWVPDEDGAVSRMAKDTALNIIEEARAAPSHDTAKAIIGHAKSSQNKVKLDAMVTLAQTEKPVVIPQRVLDTHPFLLGVENGVVDLKTGKFLPARKNDYLTKATNATFLPEAECPQWLAFLDRVTAHNKELVSFLQRGVGYSLTASTAERVLFFLYGQGANGKTTFLNTIKALFGSYSITADSSSFMVRRDKGPSNDLARLRGARFVAASEIEEGQRLDEASVKSMTGDEEITARFLYGEHFNFKPDFKLWIAGNHRPVIRGTDYAIWSRILLLPFNVQIPKQERDPKLGVKLLAEWSGILNWAIRGCLEWQSQGLNTPECIKVAVDSYRQDMDLIGDWLSERCQVGVEFKEMAGTLHTSYRTWATLGNHYVMNTRDFKVKMEERGFTRLSKTNKGFQYQGLRVRLNAAQ